MLILSFLVYKINLKYIERYYKPNVLEISIAYNFYIISSLFAISSNNFISFYLSLELQSLSWISLNYLITFVLTSGRPSPTLIEAGIKNFWLSIVFSYGIWIGISLSYCFTGQTDISKAFTMDSIKYVYRKSLPTIVRILREGL